MPQITANGIQIEYDERGNPDDPALLLIMGYTAQMVAWPNAFCDMIAAQGFRVIRFDNRDVGLTQKFEEFGVPNLQEAVAGLAKGEVPEAGYTLEDMADDAAGLLDALGISAAHIMGASMGGMIAQLFALRHPEMTLSLISVMSSTGRPGVGVAKPEAAAALMSAPASTSREDVVAHSVKMAKILGSPENEFDEALLTELLGLVYDRSYYPQGIPRQYVAILATPPRHDRLGDITAPTLVIHGADDALIPPDGGEDTARSIPGARLEILQGMGHDLPLPRWQQLVDLIVDHAKGAAAQAA